ncbi:Imm8 family immunity protein [Marininema halotolerans]|uniref:Immunity protein 8 n=1 Tax=Marininema halotolerans TaxID=1155944 RepID=A0A1I6UNW8_9BACL|nr:Imm8 family immunity protein [Marininema halotolerans]SFT03149.1 Immunity protein 8 [Marininema halotolerans]
MLSLQLMRNMDEQWDDVDHFHLSYDIDIGVSEDPYEYEVFQVDVVSPKRLASIVEDGRVECGRGYLIMSDFDIHKVNATIKRILTICEAESFEQSVDHLSKYFRLLSR